MTSSWKSFMSRGLSKFKGRFKSQYQACGFFSSCLRPCYCRSTRATVHNGATHPCGNIVQLGKDEFSWTKLISAQTKSGRGKEALRIYSQMRHEGIMPKTYTFVAALKACSSFGDIQTSKQIHAHVIASGNQTNLFVASTLIDMYTKYGCILDAYMVFDSIKSPDLVLWNAMIVGYAQREEGQLALDLYMRMQDEGFKPDAYTFVAALKACSSLAIREEGVLCNNELLKIGSLEKGRSIHFQARKDGFESHMFVGSSLIDMYVKCGSMVDAQCVFEKMPHRDLVLWTSMIIGYAEKDAELSLELFASMQQEGFKPDACTFTAALKACSSLAAQGSKELDAENMKRRCLERGSAIHRQVKIAGFESDMYVANTLVDMYATCGSMVDACQIFEEMQYHDTVTWNAMIMGYAQSGEGAFALQFYERMQDEGFKPNDYTFVAVLKACTALAVQEEGMSMNGECLKGGWLEKGRAIHSEVVKSGFESNLFVANTLVDMYAKCGNMVDAREVFEKMLHHTVVSWNALVMGYAQLEKGDLALQLYARMQEEGFSPDAYTFVAALKACGTVGSLKSGKEIHAQICRVGLESNLFIATGLVEMYSRCGSMVDAQGLFDKMSVKSSMLWDVLIAGYSGQGDNDHVLSLFERMQQEGIKPVEQTFVFVLAVCSHTGLVDKGQKCFQALCLNYGISPSNEHYNCMVDLLIRAGQLDEGVNIVKKMPFTPDIVMWKTILGGCQKWNNVESGRHAFECALGLDEEDISAYVMMLNIYVSGHTREEMAKIEEMRKKTQALKKQ